MAPWRRLSVLAGSFIVTVYAQTTTTPLACEDQDAYDNMSCQEALDSAELYTCLEAQTYMPNCAHCVCDDDYNPPNIESACSASCTTIYLESDDDDFCPDSNGGLCCEEDGDPYFYVDPDTDTRSCFCSFNESSFTCPTHTSRTTSFFLCNNVTMEYLESARDGPCTVPFDEGCCTDPSHDSYFVDPYSTEPACWCNGYNLESCPGDWGSWSECAQGHSSRSWTYDESKVTSECEKSHEDFELQSCTTTTTTTTTTTSSNDCSADKTITADYFYCFSRRECLPYNRADECPTNNETTTTSGDGVSTPSTITTTTTATTTTTTTTSTTPSVLPSTSGAVSPSGGSTTSTTTSVTTAATSSTTIAEAGSTTHSTMFTTTATTTRPRTTTPPRSTTTTTVTRQTSRPSTTSTSTTHTIPPNPTTTTTTTTSITDPIGATTTPRPTEAPPNTLSTSTTTTLFDGPSQGIDGEVVNNTPAIAGGVVAAIVVIAIVVVVVVVQQNKKRGRHVVVRQGSYSPPKSHDRAGARRHHVVGQRQVPASATGHFDEGDSSVFEDDSDDDMADFDDVALGLGAQGGEFSDGEFSI